MKSRTPAFAVVLIIVIFFVLRAARVVPAGHVGVVDLFGKVRVAADYAPPAPRAPAPGY